MICLPAWLALLGGADILLTVYLVFWAAYIWWLEGSWLAKRRQELADLLTRLRR